MINRESKAFGKLIGAIAKIDHRSVVKWRDNVNEQLFDVTIRSKHGSNEYLMVIDCFASENKVSIKEISDFASRVRIAGAHMSLLVASSGYEEDVLEAAGKQAVKLLALEDLNKMAEDDLRDLFKPVLLIHSFRFRQEEEDTVLAIPEEPGLLKVLMNEIRINGPGIDTVPEKLVNDSHDELDRAANQRPQAFSIPFPKGTTLSHPNTGDKVAISAFSFVYQLISVSDLKTKDALGSDPYALGTILKEELAKRNPTADPQRIEVGFDTTLETGKYYYNPKMQFSYYCEAVKKGKATLVLAESYQSGGLLQARFDLSVDLAKQFVEVTEQSEIDRLSRIYESFAVSGKKLEDRFKVFVKNLDGAELIDDLTLTPEQRDKKKADFFFDHRKVIGELKSLQTDAAGKIDAILKPYQESPEWPVFFGEWDLQKVLNHLPDKEQINRQLFTAITDSIENVIKGANRQIRTTKETFNLPDAGGVLIILNDVVEIFSPDLIIYRVRKSLHKQTPEGKLRFPHVTAVLVINVTHYTQLTPDLKGMPLLIIPSSLPDADKVVEFVQSILPKWAAFDGQPLIKIEPEELPKLKYKKFSDTKEKKGPLTVQDLWSWEYKQDPYLRSLNKEDLLQRGRQLLEDIGARMLKGAPKTPKEQMMHLMSRFTHFMDEVNFRGIDMRDLKLGGMNEKLDALYKQYQKQSASQGKNSRTSKPKKQSKAYKNKIGRGAPCPCQSGKTYRRCCGKNSSAD
jgi:hypothetical protein